MAFLNSLSEPGSLFLVGGLLIGVAALLRRVFSAFHAKHSPATDR